jgi:hypothetical protein
MADVKRKAGDDVGFLLYLVAHVLALGLGYLLGDYLLEVDNIIIRNLRIDLLPLIFLYVVLFIAHLFVAYGLDKVFGLSQRLNLFLFMFLSYLVLIASYVFLISFLGFWLSDWRFSFLYWIYLPSGCPPLSTLFYLWV